MPINLSDFPEFCALQQLTQQLVARVDYLEKQLPEWVDELEAQRLTDLSRSTLSRLRDAGKLVWKKDHGVRYERASLLAHNESRAIGRGHLFRALTS